jgi:hypothetical protein
LLKPLLPLKPQKLALDIIKCRDLNKNMWLFGILNCHLLMCGAARSDTLLPTFQWILLAPLTRTERVSLAEILANDWSTRFREVISQKTIHLLVYIVNGFNSNCFYTNKNKTNSAPFSRQANYTERVGPTSRRSYYQLLLVQGYRVASPMGPVGR